METGRSGVPRRLATEQCSAGCAVPHSSRTQVADPDRPLGYQTPSGRHGRCPGKRLCRFEDPLESMEPQYLFQDPSELGQTGLARHPVCWGQ